MSNIRTCLINTCIALTTMAAMSSAPAFAGEQPAADAATSFSVLPATSTNCSTYCAVVNSDGSLARGHAFTTSSHISTGEYEVDFYAKASSPKDISKCVWLATPGFGTFSGDQSATFVTVAGRVDTTNGVWVHTFDQTGASVDAPFLLEVSC